MVNDSFFSQGACRISRGSSLLCWGTSQIRGDGLDSPSNTFDPAQVAGFSSGVSDVSVGKGTVCAIRNGDLFCWGENSAGEAGVGGTLPVSTPAPVVPPVGQQFTSVKSGAMSQTCAITNSGALYCWGDNDSDQRNLGVGSADAYVTAPAPVLGMDSGVTAVDVGSGSICGVKFGALYCWGANPKGELGFDSGGVPVSSPAPVVGLESGVTAVSVGDRSRSGSGASSICAIQNAALVCLGENDLNQLGDGGGGMVNVATPHPTLQGGVTSVVITGAGGCGIHLGVVKCWGAYVDPLSGVVDLSSNTPSVSPVSVAGLPDGVWSSVIGNGGGFCARSLDLREYCWGLNLNGALFSNASVGQAALPIEAGPFD